MGKLAFDRPIGANADVEELLYIAALHQAPEFGAPLRRDGSIIASDIATFLLSRHGIKIHNEAVQNTILHGFKDNSRLDLVEAVTLLFIPQLCKTAESSEMMNLHGDYDNAVNKEATLIGPEVVDPKIIQFVLDAILYDVTGDKEPKELTDDLICEIFHKYGEEGLLCDQGAPNLMEMMKEVATNGRNKSDKTPLLLDRDTFLHLLTNDLKQYNNNHDPLTYIGEVFGNDFSNKKVYEIPKHNDEEYECSDNNLYVFEKVKTAKAIDYAAGGYVCKYRVVFVWISFIFGFIGFIYYPATNITLAKTMGCNQGFGCEIAASVLQWLSIFVLIMVFGFSWIILDGSIPEKHVWLRRIATAILITLLCVVPYRLTSFQLDTPWLFYSQILTYIFSCLTILKRLEDEFRTFFPNKAKAHTTEQHESYSKRAGLNKVKLIQENAFRLQSHVKDGRIIKTHYGNALSNFSELQDETEETGGILWAWRKYRNKEIFYIEGIWISARFITSQILQLMTCTLLLIIGISTTISVSNSWLPVERIETTVTDLLNLTFTTLANKAIVQNTVNRLLEQSFAYLLQFLGTLDNAGILQFDCFALSTYLVKTCSDKATDDTQFACSSTKFACTLFNSKYESLCESMEAVYRPLDAVAWGTDVLTIPAVFNTTPLKEPFVNLVTNAVSENVVIQVNRFYPQGRHMVTIPIAVGAAISVVVSFCLAIMVIPSLISIVLKLRCGLIPTMKKKDFTKYHNHTMNTTKLLGGMFWSNLVASIIVGCAVALLMFFFLWQVTFPLALTIVALFIGVGSIVIVRWLSTRCFMNASFRGFYRVKPFRANIDSLAHECVNVGLTITMAVSRAIVLFFLSMFHVGHLDIPFIAEDVGDYFNSYVQLEPYEKWFLTAVLSVEAHRHPYLETLGLVYLLKLKYGSSFNNRIGIIWRTIFVSALMPWLVKFRKRNVEETQQNILMLAVVK